MRGSDSERMMAEIEAFLRTGQAPPAAPEPPPVASVPDFPVSEPEGEADRRVEYRRHPGLMSRVQGLLRRGSDRSWGLGRSGGTGGMGDPLRPARLGGGHGGLRSSSSSGSWGQRPLTPGRPAEPPKWTPLRVVIVVAVIVALLVVPVFYSGHSSSNPNSGDHASAAPAGPGYSFLRVNRSGTPVRWNPCSPLYYVTDLSAAPAYAATDLQKAVADISRATGILFVNSGTTGAFPSTGPMVTPGGQVGPVVIAWADPAQTAQMDLPVGASGADALGRTVPVAAVDQAAGHGVYVTGTMMVSSAAKQLPEGFGPGGLGVLFLHQLGHLVGLGSVTGPGEIMSTNVLSSPTTAFGAGDLAGLERLGTASGCLQVPSGATYQPSLTGA